MSKYPMDFNEFADLGDQLQLRFRQCNHDEWAFPALAADTLSLYDEPFSWDPQAIGRYLTSSTVAQDPHFEFSNLPIIVYRCPEFYIELLIWTSATTSIHQHSFSGAFKVLTGSSLHACYNFREQRRINHRLRLGEVVCEQVEYLRQGDIREIRPGAEGLSHSLFHLDHPSVTLVIRTPGMQTYLPQMTLFPPCFAYSEPDMGMDIRNTMLQRLLDTARDIDDAGFVSLLINQIPRLDFASLFYLSHENRGLFQPQTRHAEFFTTVANCHGAELADCLSMAIQEALRVDSLRAARRGTKDGELRFFMALLMNIRSREPILDMLRQRFPGEDAVLKCASLLGQLCDQRQDAGRMMAKLAASAGISDYRLGARIAGAVPGGTSVDQRRELLARLLAEPSVAGNHNGANPDKEALAALQAIDELKPLFSKD